MYKLPHCQYCNIDLDIIDYNEEWVTDSHLIVHTSGSCPKCYKDFEWDEIYNLVSIDNIKEI